MGGGAGGDPGRGRPVAFTRCCCRQDEAATAEEELARAGQLIASGMLRSAYLKGHQMLQMYLEQTGASLDDVAELEVGVEAGPEVEVEGEE